MKKKIADERIAALLFGLCWSVYFISYVGRLNFSSVMASMNEDGVLSLTQAGTVSMVYFFAYAAGQLINGALSDRARPQGIIFLGLCLSGLGNLLMAVLPVYPWSMVFWGINGYAQSMIWPAMIRIFAEKYSEEKKRKCSIDIATSLVIGTFTSYLLSALLLKYASWRYAYYIPAALLLIMAVCWLAGYGYVERSVEKNGLIIEPEEQTTPIVSPSNGVSLWDIIVGSGIAVILLPVVIHGVLKDGVPQWVPTYIYQRFDVSASFSVVLTMILPLFNLAGAYMARWADMRHPQQEVRSTILFFAVSTAALILLLTVGRLHAVLAAVLFAVITSSILAANTLFVNLVPLHFEKEGKVATVSGFLNAIAYLGSAISTYAISLLADKYGWDVTLCIWIGLSLLALICVVLKRNTDISMKE